MLLNEHILIAQDPRGNILNSHSKHGRFIYWPWRVLFIQIEIKRQRGRKSFPGLIYLHEVNRSHRENVTLPTNWDNEHYSTQRTAYIFTALSAKGLNPCNNEEKQPICKTVGMFTGVLWFVVVCLLMSVKIAVMELVGRCHSWRRATSPPLAVKASDPRVLHPSSSSASLGPLLQKHRPTFRNASAIKPDGFNVPDPVVSNAISFNPICGEIALER